MKHPTFIIAASLLMSLAAAPALAADTRYITDSLEITMRAGNTTQHRITRMLRSGTRVEILKIDKGWAHVATDDGREGWVLTRFLIKQPVARERLAKAEAKLKTLTEADARLRSELGQFQEYSSKLEAENTQLQNSNEKLDKDLKALRAATADTVSVIRANSLLKAKVNRLNNEISDLREENQNYRDNSAQAWFVRGAAVIFGGILLGLLLPRIPLPRRKRDRWSSL